MTARRWWTVSAVLALAGAALLVSGTSGADGPPQPAATGTGRAAGATAAGSEQSLGDLVTDIAPTRTTAPGSRRWVAPLPASDPVWLEVPAIGLRTPLASLGLTRSGLIDVPAPTRGSPAGWYRYSRTPGERGAAVIVGHVDSAHDGPAVFYRLGELAPGDPITVHRADGSTAMFTVQRVAVVPKDRFPVRAVYGPTRRPVLRLVTCGGSFDHLRGHYRDNLVVFAVLTGTRPAAL